MRIHEAITVNQELDLLEAHLREHSRFVDKFFIKESSCLWTGPPKPLHVRDNLSRFSDYNIELVEVPAKAFAPIPRQIRKDEHEHYMRVRRDNRDAAKAYYWDEMRQGCDYLLATDADEIIDSRRYEEVLALMESEMYLYLSLKLEQHVFWVNAVGKKKIDIYRVYRADQPYRNKFKGLPRASTDRPVGWHFTNCYSPEDIRQKLLGGSLSYGFTQISDVPSASKIAADLAQGRNPVWPTREMAFSRILSYNDRYEWAPQLMAEEPQRFPWY